MRLRIDLARTEVLSRLAIRAAGGNPPREPEAAKERVEFPKSALSQLDVLTVERVEQHRDERSLAPHQGHDCPGCQGTRERFAQEPVSRTEPAPSSASSTVAKVPRPQAVWSARSSSSRSPGLS